jgi:2-polyprenyl-3-methyl-5-hydroxy-6-metoxy-1,4-benzoquinol methylase
MVIFGSYARYYDLLYKDKDYPAEVTFVESLMHQYAGGEIKSILDLGCGTGGHAILLAEKGFDVTGVDRSEDMLSIAREKATTKNITVNFVKANIRDVKLNREFDIIIAMFAVMSYQTTNDDFEQVLKTAYRHLKSGGLFIFDVWFGPAVIAQKPSDRVKIVEQANEKIIRLTRSALDIMKHTVDVHFTVMRIGDNVIQDSLEETHKMRFFFPMEIELLLQNSGFHIVKRVPFMNAAGLLSEATWDMTVVARKVAKW